MSHMTEDHAADREALQHATRENAALRAMIEAMLGVWKAWQGADELNHEEIYDALGDLHDAYAEYDSDNAA